MKALFRSRRGPAAAPAVRRWIAGAYGSRADELMDGLPALMKQATAEARLPRTRASAPVAAESTAAAALATTLTELRSLALTAEVTGDDSARDLRFRAALADAIGGARGLALASSSQPTKGDLASTLIGVNAVLLAAGRPGLPMEDALPRGA
jgi:hypothetical protein